MQRLEQNLQIACVDFLKVALVYPADFFSVPNGGLRTKREASLFRATGVRAGVPDMLIIWPGNVGGIELKAPKTGRLSPEQIEWGVAFNLCRHHFAVCDNFNQVLATLQGWRVPMRIREAVI